MGATIKVSKMLMGKRKVVREKICLRTDWSFQSAPSVPLVPTMYWEIVILIFCILYLWLQWYGSSPSRIIDHHCSKCRVEAKWPNCHWPWSRSTLVWIELRRASGHGWKHVVAGSWGNERRARVCDRPRDLVTSIVRVDPPRSTSLGSFTAVHRRKSSRGYFYESGTDQ